MKNMQKIGGITALGHAKTAIGEMKMNTKQFGETVQGYDIPVLNEREVRASAGILFLFLFSAWMFVVFQENFFMMKLFITIFLSDFLMRLLIAPRFSPSLIIGRWIVRRQHPEYVGAVQKQFAWKIGLVLSSIMFIHMVVFNSYSIITGLICQICLIFLFFESAFGICLGCLMYGWFYKTKTQYCPGEICDVKTRQAIQRISPLQISLVIAFLVYVIATAVLFQDGLSAKPADLWLVLQSALQS